MKKLNLLVCLLVGLLGYTQTQSTTMNIGKVGTINQLKAGSCASPDGPTTLTSIVPPDYQYLEDNGFCLYSYTTTSAFTACYTVTSPGTALDFNAGFSHTCNNVSFNNFRLYDAATCSLVGTGLSYTGLSSGTDYVWCLDMRAWGGPSCNGFDNFCPYYMDMTPLPITLVDFSGDCDKVSWTTSSEMQCSHYSVEGSVDGIAWTPVNTRIPCFNSIYGGNYFVECKSDADIQYYRLTQYDFNGHSESFPPIALDCQVKEPTVERVYSILGEDLGTDFPDYSGLFVVLYSNGAKKKIFRTVN